eukprot:53705-Rhodomonas_salina.1
MEAPHFQRLAPVDQCQPCMAVRRRQKSGAATMQIADRQKAALSTASFCVVQRRLFATCVTAKISSTSTACTDWQRRAASVAGSLVAAAQRGPGC